MKDLARLILTSSDDGTERSVALSEGDYTIGSGLECDLVFLDQAIPDHSATLSLKRNRFELQKIDAGSLVVQLGDESPRKLADMEPYTGTQSCEFIIDDAIFFLELNRNTELLVISQPVDPSFFQRLRTTFSRLYRQQKPLVFGSVLCLISVGALGASKSSLTKILDAMSPVVVGPVHQSPQVSHPHVEDEIIQLREQLLGNEHEPDHVPRQDAVRVVLNHALATGDAATTGKLHGKRDVGFLKDRINQTLAKFSSQLAVDSMTDGRIYISGTHTPKDELRAIERTLIRNFDFITTVYFIDIDNVKNEKIEEKIIGVSWSHPKFVATTDGVVNIGEEIEINVTIVKIEQKYILIEEDGKISRINVKG